MTEAEIWKQLAKRWQMAAADVAPHELRRCYLERAAAYERLARRESKRRTRPAAQRRLH